MSMAEVFAATAKGFSGDDGPFFDAKAIWPGTPTKDAGGAITSPGTASSVDCSAQVDNATELMRRDPEYKDGDVRLIVIDIDDLDTDARIKIEAGPRAGTWLVEAISRDPASIGFDCRGRLA